MIYFKVICKIFSNNSEDNYIPLLQEIQEFKSDLHNSRSLIIILVGPQIQSQEYLDLLKELNIYHCPCPPEILTPLQQELENKLLKRIEKLEGQFHEKK
jgi:hypothetical protein